MGGGHYYIQKTRVSIQKQEKKKTKFPTLAQSSLFKKLCDSNSVPQWKPIYTKDKTKKRRVDTHLVYKTGS